MKTKNSKWLDEPSHLHIQSDVNNLKPIIKKFNLKTGLKKDKTKKQLLLCKWAITGCQGTQRSKRHNTSNVLKMTW